MLASGLYKFADYFVKEMNPQEIFSTQIGTNRHEITVILRENGIKMKVWTMKYPLKDLHTNGIFQ